MNLLIHQLLPGHVIGQVPGGGLGGSLIELAGAEQLAKFLDLGIAGEGFDRADFVGHDRGRLFLAMLEANRFELDLGDLLGRNVKRSAAPDAAADTASPISTTAAA